MRHSPLDRLLIAADEALRALAGVAAPGRPSPAAALPEANQLIANYRELRRIEAILRRWSYEGETVLPDEPAPYRRVSIRCGFASPEAFRESLAANRRAIREVYLGYSWT